MRLRPYLLATLAAVVTASAVAFGAGSENETFIGNWFNSVNGYAVNGTTVIDKNGALIGSIAGNAATATALAANPTDCSTSQFANAIAASGNLTCSALTLAGAQFANQGTTTTVLHGNAAGNPSFAAVSLTADVSGVTPKANGGTAADNTNVTFPSTGTIPVIITGTASITPGTLTASTCADSGTTITATGAAVGDACSLGTPAAGAGTHVAASCYISATSVATVRFCDVNTSNATGTTGTYRATVVH